MKREEKKYLSFYTNNNHRLLRQSVADQLLLMSPIEANELFNIKIMIKDKMHIKYLNYCTETKRKFLRNDQTDSSRPN